MWPLATAPRADRAHCVERKAKFLSEIRQHAIVARRTSYFANRALRDLRARARRPELIWQRSVFPLLTAILGGCEPSQIVGHVSRPVTVSMGGLMQGRGRLAMEGFADQPVYEEGWPLPASLKANLDVSVFPYPGRQNSASDPADTTDGGNLVVRHQLDLTPLFLLDHTENSGRISPMNQRADTIAGYALAFQAALTAGGWA